MSALAKKRVKIVPDQSEGIGMIKLKKVKTHPGWKNALERIVDRIEEEGFGIVITHDEISSWADIPEPNNNTTVDSITQYQFKRMKIIKKIRNELLDEYGIYLENKRGIGYYIPEPREQITKTSDKIINTAKSKVILAASVVASVPEEFLNTDESEIRLRKLQRIAFIRQAFSSRKKISSPNSKRGKIKSAKLYKKDQLPSPV